MSEALELLQLEPEVAQFKATETVATGLRTLEFYAAAFSKTPDANGDVIEPHAFDDWLEAFYAAGKPLPLSFSHAAVLDGLDPTNVIGYAPADATHVWVDDYGLRVRGFIDTSSEKGKAVEWQIENGLIGGASIAFIVAEGGRTKVAGGKSDGAMRITKIREVREAGPTPNPANQEAVLLWMKSEHMTEEPTDLPYMSVDEYRTILLKAVDDSAWDGDRAMSQCKSAADYRSISFERSNDSDPDSTAHWTLPHHYLGRGPNAAGVSAATAALNGARGGTPELKNASAVRSHLEAHRREIGTASDPEEPEAAAQMLGDAFLPEGVDDELVTLRDKVTELIATKHAASPTYIQAAHDALVRGGAKCADGGAETTTASSPEEEDADRLRRLRFMKTSIIR